jgi:hypothetical protein
MTFVRQWVLRIAGFRLTWVYGIYRVHPIVWRFMARNYRPWMARFARVHAWMTCQFAALDVRFPPAARVAVPLVRPVVLPTDGQGLVRRGLSGTGALPARPDRDRRQCGRRVVRLVGPPVQLDPQPP